MPFLDHELVELAAACPPALKLDQGGKGVLKDIGRGLLPVEVVDRPKGYFPVPAISHLEDDYLELVRDALTSDAARERALFEPAEVKRLLAEPNEHMTPLDGNKLWQLGLIELWLQKLPVAGPCATPTSRRPSCSTTGASGIDRMPKICPGRFDYVSTA